MAFGDAQLRAFFRTGPVVAFNGVSTYSDGTPVQGLFDRAVTNVAADQGYGGIDLGKPMLSMPWNAFAVMPTNGDIVLVGGVPYEIADSGAEDDGAVLCYALKLTQ